MGDITLIKVLTPAILTFCIGIALTPFVTRYLYAYRIWKTRGGKVALDGTTAHEFNRLHGSREREVPRMGGVVVWGSALITITGIAFIAAFFPSVATLKLDFLSRAQTWIPLSALLLGGLLGALNDIYDVYGKGEGIRLRMRLVIIALASAGIGWWFYDKLDVTSVMVPLYGPLFLGIFIIPSFILGTLFIYASGTIDGIDGLAGGVFASVFSAYAGIALINTQIDLAAFCAMIVGAVLAFLWFNIPPARFFMTETGTMALTLSLATIVFMTDALGGGFGIALFPVAGVLLCTTVITTVLHILSKKILKKKLLRIAPLHHHFEALGWPSYKVTMRYWIISIIAALFAIALASVGA